MGYVTLDIYVDDACSSCETAEQLGIEAREWFPDLRVEIHRLESRKRLPAGIVAVPAYVLDGQVLQYGTPERSQIGRALLDAFSGRLPQFES